MTCGPLDVLVSRECAGGPERPRHGCGHQAGQVSCSASTTSSTCARRHLDAAHKLVAPAVGEVALFRASADSLTNPCGTRIDPGDCGLQLLLLLRVLCNRTQQVARQCPAVPSQGPPPPRWISSSPTATSSRAGSGCWRVPLFFLVAILVGVASS